MRDGCTELSLIFKLKFWRGASVANGLNHDVIAITPHSSSIWVKHLLQVLSKLRFNDGFDLPRELGLERAISTRSQ